MAAGRRIVTVSIVSVALALSARAFAQTNEGIGEFEGVYKVGGTACTVSPVKMAYEVQWVDRSKPEIIRKDKDDALCTLRV